MAPKVSSLLSLLDESDPTLQFHALTHLLTLVDVHWPEISEKIVRIEELAEQKDFAHADHAAALVRFFCLIEYKQPSYKIWVVE